MSSASFIHKFCLFTIRQLTTCLHTVYSFARNARMCRKYNDECSYQQASPYSSYLCTLMTPALDFFPLPRRLRRIVKSATGGKWSKGGLEAWHIMLPPHHLDHIMHIVLIGPTNHRWYLHTQLAPVARSSCSFQLVSRSCISVDRVRDQTDF